MLLTPFATSADLADRLGIEFTAAESTRANSLLALASGLVQTEAGQEIERTAADTLTRPGSYSSRVRLPERPVESVSSVTLDGVLLDEDEWHVDVDMLVRTRVLSGAVFPHVPGGGWGTPEQTLVVVYTHGFAVIPDAVKAVTMEAVVRVWINPGAVMREQYGAEQVAYAQQAPRGLLLTEAERRLVRDALRRQAGTTQLR